MNSTCEWMPRRGNEETGRGWGWGEGPERGLETCVEEEEEAEGGRRMTAARGGIFISRSSGAYLPTTRLAARIPGPLGGPRLSGPWGSGRRDPLSSGESPNLLALLGWGSEPLGAR